MRLLLLVLFLLFAPTVVLAQEQVTLTSPIVTTQTIWTINNVVINVAAQSIGVFLTGDQGQRLEVFYPTPAPLAHPSQPTGAVLLHSLNIGNFSGTTSLVHAVFNRLITDGYISGTVSGTPQ